MDTWLPKGTDFAPAPPANAESQPGNTIAFKVWWGGPLRPRKITVDLLSDSMLKGVCINGPQSALNPSIQDYTFRASDNAPWTTQNVTAHANGTVNATQMITTNAYSAGVQVRVVITSFDWGGRVILRVSAPDCNPVSVMIPKDTDGDRLPNAWESGKQFWAWDTALKGFYIATYNTDALLTYGATGANDGESDGDLDQTYPAMGGAEEQGPIHKELGDGFSAFEEYRGVWVPSNRHARFNELGPLGKPTGADPTEVSTTRGTALKNAFIFSENETTNPHPLPFDPPRISGGTLVGNPKLRKWRMAWTMVDQAHMVTSVVGGTKHSGAVNFNSAAADKVPGRPQQNGAWIHKEALATRLGDSPLGFSNTLTIRVDTDDIVATNPTVPESVGEVRWHVVGHESGHKVFLQHPYAYYAFTATPITDPVGKTRLELEHFWATAQPDGTTIVNYWVPVRTFTAQNGTPTIGVLEDPVTEDGEPLSQEGLNPAITGTTQVGGVITGVYTIHWSLHSAVMLQTVIAAGTVVNQDSLLHTHYHTGYLMDHLVEHGALQSEPDPFDKLYPSLLK